jgi:HAMP domain-containing protein
MTYLQKKWQKYLGWLQEQKFSLLNTVVVVICFVFLPGLILIKGIEATTNNYNQTKFKEKQQQLINALDELEFFSANDRFAHFLLSNLCRSGSGNKYSQIELKKRISRLKKLFPNSFSFVVADLKGKIIREISDESSYLYLYKKAFNLVTSLLKNIDSESPMKAVENLETTISRLRPLLGEILRTQDLFLPLQGIKNGKSILASGSEKKFHIWYGQGKDFLIIAYISRDFIRKITGLEWAVKRLNKTENSILTGYSSYPPAIGSLQPKPGETDSTRIIKALAGAEQAVNPMPENSAAEIVATRFLTHEVRGFSLFKSGSIKEAISKQIYAKMFCWLLISAFVFFVRQKLRPISLTVKIKISAFFAYAIILPILVIGSLANQFLQQSETEVVSELHQRSQLFIEDFDAKYELFKIEKAQVLSELLEKEFQADRRLFHKKDKVRQLNRKVSKLVNHGELMVVDDSGKDYLLGISPRLTTNSTLIRTISQETVSRLLDPDATKLNKRTSSFHMYTNVYRDQNHIQYFGVGEMDLNVFLKVLIHPDFLFGYMVLVFWQESRLNEQFIQQNQVYLKHPEAKFAAFNTESGKMLVSPEIESGELLNLFQKVGLSRISIKKRLRINGREYISMAMPGQKLEKMLLSALFPAELVTQKIELLKIKALLLMLLLIFLSIATVYLLQNWIFQPLQELKVGIEAFAQRNFHKRLTVSSKNELGKLMLAFNDSFETLQDLEVAKIVQESVLPDPYLSLNNLEIIAKTEVMTRLGGDYFDILPQKDEKVLIFIGDATGHGIPAALSMAMAKSVMIHESLADMDQEKLMQKLHELFKSVRKAGSKDFMTAASIIIDSQTGVVSFINAGHCHPLLLKKSNPEASIFELQNGMPLGFGLKRKFVKESLNLESGDILIFYTDGFYECTNQNKEVLGFDGFRNLVASSRNSNLDIFAANIFSQINQWEATASDDKTLIMVRMR